MPLPIAASWHGSIGGNVQLTDGPPACTLLLLHWLCISPYQQILATLSIQKQRNQTVQGVCTIPFPTSSTTCTVDTIYRWYVPMGTDSTINRNKDEDLTTLVFFSSRLQQNFYVTSRLQETPSVAKEDTCLVTLKGMSTFYFGTSTAI